ncbi:MAG: hypothetical protein AB1498_03840 [bacterium]
MKKEYKICFFVAVLLIVFFSSFNVQAQRKSRQKQQGLETKGRSKVSITPNIHMQLGCESCHMGRPKPEDKDIKLLMPNNDIVELCKSCHEDADHHKVNVVPSDAVKVPDFLPLGVDGVSKGKVVCSTCHYTHVELAVNVLLRGFPQDENDKTAKFGRRLDLCDACHGKEFTKKSPHTDDEAMCSFCHSSDPKKAKDVLKETIKRDIIELCDFCHGTAVGGHFLEVNPFADKSIRKEFPTTLPVIDGAISCITCHNPHGNTGVMYILRPDYQNFAVKSREINPHEKRVFCLSCHEKTPEKGAADASVKFGSDVEMCNWCHKQFEEGAGHHPLSEVHPESKMIKRSEGYPLKNNKIICLTCHDRKFECEQGKLNENIAEKNPSYLLGGPFEGRSDICFKCHIKEEIKKINPHKMVDEKGGIVPERCKYCHSLPPDKIVEGSKNIGLIGDVNFLCILCHLDRDHPGTKKDGTGAKHLIKIESTKEEVVDGKIVIVENKNLKPIKDIPVNLLPLDEKGWITCGTCHQVHSKGIIKGERGKVEDVGMWRMPQDQLCTSCHPF